MCLNTELLANAALHPALLLPAALHGLHSTRQLCFYRQTRAGEGPGPLQRRPSPLPMSPRLPVPYSGFAGFVSCHSALCGRSWRGQMPGQPKAEHLIRVVFPPPSSPPLSPKAGGWRLGNEKGKRQGAHIRTSSPVCVVHIRGQACRWMYGQCPADSRAEWLGS